MIPKAAFICHSSEDALVAAQLVGALESRGANCWIAPRNIRAGASYPEEIVTALQATDCFIIILTAAANLSPHVLRELEMAVSLRKTVVPVRVDGAQLSQSFTYLLASLQWIDTSRRAFQSEPAIVAETILGQRFAQAPKKQKVARITVTQAVLVTSIAVVAGLIAMFIARAKPTSPALTATPATFVVSPSPSPMKGDPHLLIDHAKLTSGNGNPKDLNIRVVVNINGRRYAYPVSRPWAPASQLAGGQIPVPAEPQYRVTFQLYADDSSEPFYPIDNYAFLFPSKQMAFGSITQSLLVREGTARMSAAIHFTVKDE